MIACMRTCCSSGCSGAEGATGDVAVSAEDAAVVVRV